MPVGVLGWTLPRTFRRTLDHGSEPFLLHLDCEFEGERVAVREVAIESRNGGRSITPRDLSAVELGRAVYLLTESELRPEHALPTERRSGRESTDEELRLLASVYATMHAAWGKPRLAVMGLWSLPRATANRWIDKARDKYPEAFRAEGGDDG